MEIATYVVVALAIWVISPLLGKFLDSLYFDYPIILANWSLVLYETIT